MCSRPKCATTSRAPKSSTFQISSNASSRTTSMCSHTKATRTGWTLAARTIISAPMKTSPTWNMSSSRAMWKARLSELEFNDDESAAVLEALDSKWITAGPRTEAFEKEFAALVGTTEAIAVSNGTLALLLALKEVGIGPGDQVLVPSMTFVATAAAVIHCGAEPVFVDICSLENPTMCPNDAARKLTEKTKAMLPVHYAGVPADMDQLMPLAETHGLMLIEDAAHAPGARYNGRACGSFGAAGCFSFFGNKNITTGEGGMITTSDPELARRLRSIRSHGMTVSSWEREQGKPPQYDVLEFGFNFRFDDIRAAIGLAQLKKLERINTQRAALVQRYNQKFLETDLALILPMASIPESKQPAYHLYPIVLENSKDRDRLAERLKEDGIQTSIHYTPIHHFSAFRQNESEVLLPVTESYAAHELTLPLYPSLPLEKVDEIVAAVQAALSGIRT